jgi:hypothetical protein
VHAINSVQKLNHSDLTLKNTEPMYKAGESGGSMSLKTLQIKTPQSYNYNTFKRNQELIKGSLTRDFLLQFFFHESVSPVPH